ncbi:MAG: hypothetical protein WBX02_16220 [Terriglobales bacterium]
MKFAFKILSLTLVPVVMLAMLTTGVWMDADHASVSSIPPSDRVPPCHAHGPAGLPVPPVHSSLPRLPASYQCCLTDHAAAVVHASDCSRSPVQFTRVFRQIEPASAILLSSWRDLRTIALFDPPGAIPLRI